MFHLKKHKAKANIAGEKPKWFRTIIFVVFMFLIDLKRLLKYQSMVQLVYLGMKPLRKTKILSKNIAEYPMQYNY